MSDQELTVRQARAADREAVVAFTESTWPERGDDYIPRVFEEWVATDGPTQRTFVLDAGDDIAGICQGVLLSDHEAWAQGMRVNPSYRGRRASPRLTSAVFDWAREQGATVCRNMVFSWNAAGLGQSRSVGFDPRTEFRWATPDPDADAAGPDGLRVVADPDTAWTAWHRSTGRDHLVGLALASGESWALSELTLERLHEAAADERALAIVDGDGVRGMTFRVRTGEHETEEGPERFAEYGVGVWDDAAAARALFAAVSRDAAELGVDRTRVLIPETVRHVSDVAAARVGFSDEPDFVLEADLSGE
ncbi:GNAT family N-acetyltransferase [Haloglomus litoreum]|uniref:GNAT family N-acetyltransferase n=1 Tax=Haloglomus litoreum TaxID=3034026 RepID=UPI0023E7B1B9|nr:GNAT family N-acetyltransferase [Haloglomus sp. DT116]